MKQLSIYIFSAALLLTASCSKELERINQNPNAAENAQPDYLLTAALKNTADTYWGTNNTMNASLLFVQYWSKIQYTEQDRYIFSNSSFSELWSTGYTQGITNLNKVIEQADRQNHANYKGVALVARSWVFQLLTDAYGDIPYREAGKINEFITPAYDPQRDVYLGLLDDLKNAAALLDPAGKAVSGDIVYGGNIARWEKFANSLRLRIALRISDREPQKAKEVITELLQTPGALIGSNTENAQVAYLTSPQQNPVSALFETRDDYRVSKTLVDRLIQNNDPRLPVYVSKTSAATAQEYVGIPNGLSNGDAAGLGLARTSKPGTWFLTPQSPAVILTYAEVLFGRAEAAARGFTSEDAADLYKQAIRASLKQYAIGDDAANAYLAQASVQYDPSDYRKSIGEQKWLALYGQGLEAFSEWRRLDQPRLVPAVGGVLNGQIPVRFIYPGTEQSLNGANYKNAVAHQGADLLTTKLWFDVN